MRIVVVLALLCCIGRMAAMCGNRTDILINGLRGTQLFDPYCNDKHATGNLQLRLQTGVNAYGGAAAIDGHLAYFGSGNTGK
jgi:hypothetical protein